MRPKTSAKKLRALPKIYEIQTKNKAWVSIDPLSTTKSRLGKIPAGSRVVLYYVRGLSTTQVYVYTRNYGHVLDLRRTSLRMGAYKDAFVIREIVKGLGLEKLAQAGELTIKTDLGRMDDQVEKMLYTDMMTKARQRRDAKQPRARA